MFTRLTHPLLRCLLVAWSVLFSMRIARADEASLPNPLAQPEGPPITELPATEIPPPISSSADDLKLAPDDLPPRLVPAKPTPTKNYYVEPRSVGTRRDTEPPSYVRTLSKTGIPLFEDLNYIDFNADYRFRYEYRDDDLRRPVAGADHPFLLRTRAYLGVKEALDPFRFGIEFEDARRNNSQFPADDRDFNEMEIIQAFGELHFKDALGEERPLRFQYGRLAMEYMDRRLIARNEWRNTTNNLQGFRAILGQQKNDWQLDLLALQPIRRQMFEMDHPDPHRWFLGAIGDWRGWSEIVTLQPYYLFLDQRGGGGRTPREIHTLAVRGYGIIGDTGYDYDADIVFQFGHNGSEEHRAFGFTTELGYTFETPWKPRVSAFIGYASGDREPNDDSSQRFDRLYGFARPWSANDYFLWENLVAPKVRIDFQPHEKVRVDMGYGTFWLASETDAWANAARRDKTGQSGSFIGQELDIRLRWKATPHVDITIGYAHFISGEFTKKTGRGDDTDFFYVETSTRLLK